MPIKFFARTFVFVLTALAAFAASAPAHQDSRKHEIMELARRLYIDDLALPRDYTAGKYTAYGNPELGARATVVELEGPGEMTRLWTTQMSDRDLVNLYIYVDGADEPVLAGPARELGAAADGLISAEVPWGGFLDGKSVSLYLPIPFKKSLRVDAEYHEDLLDGPYWQIDYKRGVTPGPIPWKQINTAEGIKIVPVSRSSAAHPAAHAERKTIRREFSVSTWPQNTLLQGPALIRAIHVTSDYLDKLLLRISFDSPKGYGDPENFNDDYDFQVNAPLTYLVSNFHTAGVELHGTTASIYFPMPVRSEALIQLQYIMDEAEFESNYLATLSVEYEENPAHLDRMLYFNARANTRVANGYQDFEVMSVRGEGHFVGVNLFDTSHDHGGGDNIFFDAGTPGAAQLHGICAEDYFHHAYMRIGVSAPYIHCPSHSARARHHIEMPVPFRDSFTFNWGSFAGVMPKAVAIWYQKELTSPKWKELTYRVTGPFPLEQFGNLAPGGSVPDSVYIWKTDKTFARKSWTHRAQNRFVDLCHAFRQYANVIPPSPGDLEHMSCYLAETKIWVAREADVRLWVGCDDRIQVYLNGKLLGESDGRGGPDPFRQVAMDGKLKAGVNTVRLVSANSVNFNWKWHGFSMYPETNLADNELLYLY